MAEQSKRRSGCFWYLIPLLMVLGGIALPFIPGIKRAQQPTYVKEFLAPGSADVQVWRAGGYTLWHDYRTTFQGKVYSGNQDLPSEVQVTLKNKTTGAEVPMTGSMNSQVSINSHARRSVGGFDVPEPGTYEISVSGPITQATVFSFRENWFADVFGKTLVFGIFGIAAIVAGIVTLVVIFIWRRAK